MHETRDIPIVLPDLGEEDQPVRLAQWLVDDGEQVLEHDRVAEVLVGGILFHVTAPAEGTLRRIVEQAGSLLAPSEIIGHVQLSPAP